MRPAFQAFAAKASRFFMTAVLAVSGAGSLQATAIVMPTDDQLVAKSPMIVIGMSSVRRASKSRRNLDRDRPASGEVPPWNGRATVRIREVGGRIGDRFNIVFGSPEYQSGQRVLVFLWPTKRGDYQTRDLFAGEFLERTTTSGNAYGSAPSRSGHSLLDRDLQELSRSNQQRDAAGFEQFMAAGFRAAGVTELSDSGREIRP